MRHFINLIVTLMEAPISNTELMGDPHADQYPGRNATFDGGTGLSQIDRKILQSPKGIAKIVRAFQRTPHDFEIFFANTDAVDGDGERDNDEVDHYARVLSAGVHDEFGIIKGKSGTIRVIILSNLSPLDAGRLPISGWTLAHKIGHALQDDITSKTWDSDIGRRINEINKKVRDIADLEVSKQVYPDGGEFYFSQAVRHILTMKSARMNKLNNDFEVFAEIIAQYLIAGRVKMNVGPQIQPLVDELNELIRSLFATLDGKVLVEV